MTKKKVVVWSKQGCSYCDDVKAYLLENNIRFKTIDVTKHDEFREILHVKYGVRHVPVVEIGEGEVYRGVTEIGLQYVKAALERINV